MTKNREADATNIGLKTRDYFVDNQKAFSSDNSSTTLNSLTSHIEQLMVPGKIFRCYRCFDCERHFAATKMSTALVICRRCSSQIQAGEPRAKQNRVDRITNSLRKFLRGKMEVK